MKRSPSEAMSSTQLRLLVRHCAFALRSYKDGAPGLLGVFNVGTAAHVFAEAWHYAVSARGTLLAGDDAKDLTREVTQRLTTGDEPMPVSDAMDGILVAYNYLRNNDFDSTAHVEAKLAVDRQWRPVEYDSPKAYLRGVLDHLVTGELPDGAPGLIVTDYKSQWNAGQSMVDSLQMKIYALLVYAHRHEFGEVVGIVRRIVNLRTGRAFEEHTYLDEQGEALFDMWRGMVETLIDNASANPVPTPGACCLDCPYLRVCPAVTRLLSDRDPESWATAYAAATAVRAALSPFAKSAAASRHVRVTGGFIGYKSISTSNIRDNAHILLLHHLGKTDTWIENNGDVVNLLRLVMTVMGASAFIKAYYPKSSQRDERDGLSESVIRKTTDRRFGIFRGDPSDEEEEP